LCKKLKNFTGEKRGSDKGMLNNNVIQKLNTKCKNTFLKSEWEHKKSERMLKKN